MSVAKRIAGQGIKRELQMKNVAANFAASRADDSRARGRVMTLIQAVNQP